MSAVSNDAANDFVVSDEDLDNNVSQPDNRAWAEVMGKILNKQGPKDKKSVILAKNVEKSDEDKQRHAEQRELRKQLNKKRKWEEMNYVKPDVLEKDYERSLQKIATRGVVQLFNAVKKHQKETEEKLKSAKTEGKKEQVMKSISKGDFLDMLKGDAGHAMKPSESIKKDLKVDDGPEDDAKWSVLKDDFMMGNKLKDWDKQSDDES